MSAEAQPPDADRPTRPPLRLASAVTDLPDTEIAVAQAHAAGRALARPATPTADPRYVGLVTRGIAFAVDAAVICLIAIVVAVGVALTVTVLHVGRALRSPLIVLGSAAFVLGTVGYLVGFWTTTGQTPGNRMMQFRVARPGGATVGLGRALVRVVGLVLAALPLFAGYALIPFDHRRRGLQDRLAGTVVTEAPVISAAERRRLEGPARAGRPPAP